MLDILIVFVTKLQILASKDFDQYMSKFVATLGSHNLPLIDSTTTYDAKLANRLLIFSLKPGLKFDEFESRYIQNLERVS